MSKVTFQYNSDEEANEIRDIINLPNYRIALSELQDLRRSIYKGYDVEERIVVNENNEVMDYKTYNLNNTEELREKFFKSTLYIKEDYVIQLLDKILQEIPSELLE